MDTTGFDNEIASIYTSPIFEGMCKKFGRGNHEDLKGIVISILLRLPKAKKQTILEKNYLLPYAIQTARFQVSRYNWTEYRKLYDNRENIDCIESLDQYHNTTELIEDTEENYIDPFVLLEKIKSDMVNQENKYFYHSRLLFIQIENGINTKQLSREVGMAYTSIRHSLQQYRQHLKTWQKSAL
jgi:hypothetical protein